MSRKPRVDHGTTMGMIKYELLRWTCRKHATDCPLDRHLIRDKALELADEYGLTDFKCSERWLTCFLTKHGFSSNPKNSSGPIFSDYRVWIDTIRHLIANYQYKDLFHLDELTLYVNLSSTGMSMDQAQTETRANLKRATMLLCCNASGTEKLPLLICGSYPAVITSEDYKYSHSEDASINDALFKEWLNRVNDRMLHSERKILLLLHRNRMGAFQDLDLSNVKHIFFPDAFPPSLRPLKRDVFHLIKMSYRSKWMEGEQKKHRWSIENIVNALVEAWKEVPRVIIISSFQRTRFRSDDCLLEIYYDVWDDRKVSFEKFVTFDDDLPCERRKSPDKSHGYNLRTKESRSVDRQLDFAIDSMEKSSLKRSHDEARLDEESNNSRWNDNIIVGSNLMSRNDEDIIVSPRSAKVPKVVGTTDGITMELRGNTAHGVRSEKVDATRAIANVVLTTSKPNTDRLRKLVDEMSDCDERGEDRRARRNERSLGSSAKIDDTSDIASQQVLDDTSVVFYSDTREANVSGVNPANELEAADRERVDGNGGGHSSWTSMKRKRSCPVIAVESRSSSNDDDEQRRKKSRSDSDWTKQYETTFVFGSSSNVARTLPVYADTFADNDAVFDLDDLKQPRSRRSYETERSIFTIRPRKD